MSSALPSQPKQDPHEKARIRMVREQILRRGVTDQRILDAMYEVPRHLFVPKSLQHLAYDDKPLPIGLKQTISQPYIVAHMTALLQPHEADRVLEIGVGSGYQTAILARLVKTVVGLERLSELAEQARERLAELGIANATVHVADGSLGYARQAPYDGILVAAAAPHIPEPLVRQLAPNGRLIIPVGRGDEQVLLRVVRTDTELLTEQLTPVRFVPLIGALGFE